MNIFTAPIYALFSLDFYRIVNRSSLSKGFLYLAYLSGVMSVVIFLGFIAFVVPKADRFVEWVKSDMPPLVMTKDGLTMSAPSPYTMVYPGFGPAVIFDMNKTDVTSEEMGNVPAFVTAKKIYVKENRRGLRVLDLTEAGNTSAGNKNKEIEKPVAIDRNFVQKVYATAKPWGIVSALVFAFPLFFIGNLIEALFASLIGLVINSFRAQKFSYSQILTVSLFAITASALFGFLQLMIPALARVPFGFLGGLLVTGIYLFIGIKLTEESPAV